MSLLKICVLAFQSSPLRWLNGVSNNVAVFQKDFCVYKPKNMEHCMTSQEYVESGN